MNEFLASNHLVSSHLHGSKAIILSWILLHSSLLLRSSNISHLSVLCSGQYQ
jgi:hypothetical protein